MLGVALGFVAIVPTMDAHGRTWHVLADGTGDAPTIQAAVDSAQAGDEVLVGPGRYGWRGQGASGTHMVTVDVPIWLHSESGEDLTIIDGELEGGLIQVEASGGTTTIEGFVLTRGRYGGATGSVVRAVDSRVVIQGNLVTSCSGATVYASSGSVDVIDNRFTGNPGYVRLSFGEHTISGNEFVGGTFWVLFATSTDDPIEIADNVFADNVASPIVWMRGDGVVVRDCVFRDNTGSSGTGIVHATSGSLIGCTFVANDLNDGPVIDVVDRVLMDRCIVANTRGGPVARGDAGTRVTARCCCLYDNPAGSWVGPLDGKDGTDGNFTGVPRFCDPDGADFRLASNSPCLPGNHPTGVACGQIGALGPGCAAIEPTIWHVTPDGTGDVPTIGDAMALARTGDQIWLDPGTYTRATEGTAAADLITMRPGVRLRGPGGPSLTHIDAEGSGRGIRVALGDELTVVEGVTLRGGNADSGGGASVEAGYAQFENVVFEDNEAAGSGGALSAIDASVVRLENTRFVSNHSLQSGGALALDGGVIELVECEFSSNSADVDGGAVTNERGRIEARETSFVSNTAASRGGAVFLRRGAVFEACTFRLNDALEGGAISARALTDDGVTISGCDVVSNTATRGGGLHVYGLWSGRLDVDGTVFFENSAGQGGGLYLAWCEDAVQVTGTTLYGNTASDGAQLFVQSASPGVSTSIIAYGTGGPAIACDDSGAGAMPFFTCTDAFGNDGGDELCGELGAGNFSADPALCGTSPDLLGLDADSPCLAGSHPDGLDCGLIGARDLACGAARNFLVLADGTGEFSTIQAAMNEAANRDTITLGAGEFRGDGNRDVHFLGKNVIVRSLSDDPASSIIDCEGTDTDPHRGFVFDGPEGRVASVRVVTIRNGNVVSHADPDGGAIRCAAGASPTLDRCRFEANVAMSGGAISSVAGDPVVDGGIFVDNVAMDDGGALLLAGSGTVRGSRFEGNQARRGGAVHAASGEVTVDGCTLVENAASESGGALSAIDQILSIRSSTLVANGAPVGGGAYAAGGTLDVENTIVAFATAGSDLACDPSTTTIAVVCSDFFGNAGGDWTDPCLVDQLGADGNISADPLFCGESLGDRRFALRDDSPCAEFATACGRMGAWSSGCEIVGIAQVPAMPRRLVRVVPNPTNPSARFVFHAEPAGAPVTLTMYDALGRRVREVTSTTSSAGETALFWDGHDRHGRSLPSGVYFFRLEVAGRIETGSVRLVR